MLCPADRLAPCVEHVRLLLQPLTNGESRPRNRVERVNLYFYGLLPPPEGLSAL